MEKNCIFCRIINREIPAQVVYEDAQVLVIKDIAPKAPIHYLIIPKTHVSSIIDLSDMQGDISVNLFKIAKKIGKDLNPQAFRLLINTGKEVGQSVFHLHAHLLAGKQMSDF